MPGSRTTSRDSRGGVLSCVRGVEDGDADAVAGQGVAVGVRKPAEVADRHGDPAAALGRSGCRYFGAVDGDVVVAGSGILCARDPDLEGMDPGGEHRALPDEHISGPAGAVKVDQGFRAAVDGYGGDAVFA